MPQSPNAPLPQRLILRCPAKVNLFLAVGPKDRRGYHPLRTIFQAVGLFDELEIETGVDEPSVRFDPPTVPADNTVTKALRLMREIAHVPPMLIVVRKKIPVESGLGGGSSDAAGVIRALMRLQPGKLADSELASVAAAIGADVPFFLTGGRARAEGYGDKITPLDDRAPDWMVIAKPPVGCATGLAYARLDELRYDWQPFPETDRLYNDFERVAPCECLDLIERLLTLGARDAGLSGSGSAVFGRFQSGSDAQKAAQTLTAEKAGNIWVAPALTRRQSLEIL